MFLSCVLEKQAEPAAHAVRGVGIGEVPGPDGGLGAVHHGSAAGLGPDVLPAPPIPPQAEGEAGEPGG